MNKRDLRDIGLALALAIILCVGVSVCGCSKVESLGLFGGNSQVVKNYVYSPGVGWEPVSAQPASQPANNAPVTITVTANQTDGGTALLGKDPSGTATPEPTTQPSK